MRLLIAILVAFVCLFSPVDHASALEAADRYFRSETHAGHTFVYRMVSTGSISVEGPQPHIVTFQLSTEASVTFGPEGEDGVIPFWITFGQPAAQGLDASVAQALDATEISGTLLANGALASVTTPEVLQELGLDLGDLIIGLVAPRPDNPADNAWTVRYVRPSQPTTVPRSATLEGTFTSQGLKDWGNRLLWSVTARLRGDATLRQGAITNQIQEIGHALFYLDPVTGATEMSSVSIITNIRTIARPASDVRTRITLTTTFERRREREPVTQPTVPLPTETADPIEAQPEEAPAAIEEQLPSPVPVDELSLEPEVADEPGESSSAPESAAPADDAIVDVESGDAQPQIEPGQIESGSESEPEPESGAEPAQTEPESVSDRADSAPVEVEASETDEPEAFELEPAEPETESESEPIETESFESESIDSEPLETDPIETESIETEPPTAEPANVYVDPAGRFSVTLPDDWPTLPTRLTLRGTAFENDGEAVYVYVMPLPSVGATAESIARSAITTYQETQDLFDVVSAPSPTTLDSQAAYQAFYRYMGSSGAMVSEWAVFSRRGDRAYYVQYAREGVLESEPIPDTFLALVDSFEFGPTPSGQVDPDLLAASLEPYQDGAFRLLVPTFWPLVDRADDGSSITFVEIGGLGYLTIFARDGATGFAANDIIAAWRNEWAKEREFTLIQDLHPVQIDGRAGVGLEYSWLDEGNTGWTRRLIALIEGDTLYAVAVDYVTSGYERRADTLRAILSSFEIVEAMIEDESEADHAPDSEAPPVPTPEPEPEPEPEPQPEQPTTQPQVDERLFREPTSDESVIFLGRALTRYQPEGSALIQEEWISNARVYVRVGNDEYLGATDSDGYIYVSNLPQLSGGAFYELSRIEAPMFGFQQPVAITFQHLQVGQIAPRVAYLGIVEVTLESDRTLSVELRRPAGEGAASRSSLEHFINTFSTSAWVPFVREAIVYRDRM